MRLQIAGQRVMACPAPWHWPRRHKARCRLSRTSASTSGSVPVFSIGVRQFARLHLGRFHIGLVERIDADHRTGDSHRDLPQIEELAELIGILGHDGNHRMAALFQRRQLSPLVIDAGQPQAARTRGRRHRRPGSARFSPSMGIRPLPCLPVDSAISCSSHAPIGLQTFGGKDRDLVAPAFGGQRAQRDAEPHARIGGRRHQRLRSF